MINIKDIEAKLQEITEQESVVWQRLKAEQAKTEPIEAEWYKLITEKKRLEVLLNALNEVTQ
jgi:hypothetical protein